MVSLSLSRRQFVQSLMALGLGAGLGSCGPRNKTQIQFLRQSVPPQLIKSFQRQFPQDSALDFQAIANLQEGFDHLTTWRNPPDTPNRLGLPLPNRSPSPAQLITLGDRWLAPALQNNLLAPFDPQRLPPWSQIDPRWQLLGQRNAQGQPDPAAPVWAIPYRWGATLMVYRKAPFQRLGWEPKTWADLWRSELRQRIAMVDDPREAIGLTLKRLGYSYNTRNPDQIAALPPALQALGDQVKFFSSRHYLQALLNEDVWLAVGWSNEIMPLLKTQSALQARIPTEGTALWADLWTLPAGQSPDSPLYDWLTFGSQPASVRQMALFSQGLPVPDRSPGFLQTLKSDFPPNSPFSPTVDWLTERSEFILPLTAAQEATYDTLWQTVRTQG